ncbi:hypothetical protein BGX28_004517 [Mortierella sp. GBA30]|nr:hypothetical protein BGX28_004517 [Mortierella sp. GBA30]
MPDNRSEHSQVSLMPGQSKDQGHSAFNMQQQPYNSQEQGHPLQTNHDAAQTYPATVHENKYMYNSNNNHNIGSKDDSNQPSSQYYASPNQLEQLQLQKQHQQRLEEQIQAEDSIRIQQHRVARPNAASAVQDSLDNKANYYAYPPQPNVSSTSLDRPQDLSLKARLIKPFKFPCSNYGKALMLVIAIEALLVIIMQTIIVVQYFGALRDTPIPDGSDMLPPYLDKNNKSRSIPAYLIVFVFAQLFQLVLAWDAVRAQNTIEIIGIVIFNLCCFAYAIFEISQNTYSIKESADFFVPEGRTDELLTALLPFLIVVIAIIGLAQCLITWLAYQLFQEFGWKIYKKIGADPNMKKMYRAYQIYLVLIKVDLFFFVGFSIQFIYLTLFKRTADPEYWITIVVLPLTIVILYIAVYAVRHESRKWMATFIFAMHCGVVYFVFKVVRMYYGDKVSNYDGVRNFLVLFVPAAFRIVERFEQQRQQDEALNGHRSHVDNGAIANGQSHPSESRHIQDSDEEMEESDEDIGEPFGYIPLDQDDFNEGVDDNDDGDDDEESDEDRLRENALRENGGFVNIEENNRGKADDIEEEEDDDDEGQGYDGYLRSRNREGAVPVPVIPSAVEIELQSADNAAAEQIPEEDLKTIAMVMSSFALPAPDWAQSIPESRWLPKIVRQAEEATGSPDEEGA